MEDLNFPTKHILNFSWKNQFQIFQPKCFLQIIENVYPTKNGSLMAIGNSEQEEEALVTL